MKKALANDPSLNWKTLETPHFNIHFDLKHQSIAVKTEQIAERVHQRLSKQLNWQPIEKTDLILTDSTDFANGSATPFPRNRSTLIIQPAKSTTFDYESWLASLITHEYVHILHLDKASGAPKVLRKILGRFPLFFPNALEPTWFIEGLATYLETDIDKGIGRGQSSQFKMMMRVEVENGLKSINKVNISNTDWPLNQVYLYGEHFYRFIADKYGIKKVTEISDEYSDDLLPYFINRNAEKVLGKDLNQLWDEYTNYWNDYYFKQISEIKSKGIIVGKQITYDDFLTREFVATNDGLYFVRKNKFEESMLVFRSYEGELTEIMPINITAKLDWNKTQGLLIAQPDICDSFNIYFDLYHLKNGETQATKLTECSRYQEARWDSGGSNIIALRSDSAKFTFDRLTNSGRLIEQVWQGNDEQVISQFDISNDNKKLLISIKEPNSTRFQLKEFNINDKKWNSLTNDNVNHVFPKYSIDNSSIIYSADYNGVFNFYKSNLTTNQASQLTNVIGGVFAVGEKPKQLADNKTNYYYTGYSADGFDIYELNGSKKLAVNIDVSTKDKQTEEDIKLDNSKPIKIKDYSPWSSLTPGYWLPFSNGNQDDVEIGVQTNGSDALSIHQYIAAIGVNTDKGSPFGSVGYAYSQYLNVALSRTLEFSAEVNGVSSYIIEDELEVGLHLPLLSIQSQWDLFAGVATTQIEQGFYINDNYDQTSEFKDGVVAVGFSFNNSRRYFQSNANSDGRQVKFTAETSDILSSDFSGDVYTLDWRELIQINKEHSLALRFVQGWGTDKPNPFRLGGENSDSFILNQGEINKREYALRGYSSGLPHLRGRRMQLANLEYRFPIARIEKTLMAPPIGLGNISGKLFIDSGTTYRDTEKSYHSSVGYELNTTLHLFYNLALNLRLGYAKGHNLGGEERYYFSIGQSF